MLQLLHVTSRLAFPEERLCATQMIGHELGLMHKTLLSGRIAVEFHQRPFAVVRRRRAVLAAAMGHASAAPSGLEFVF